MRQTYPDLPPPDFDVPRTSRQGPPYYFGILGDVEAPDYPRTPKPMGSGIPPDDADLPVLQRSTAAPWVDGSGYVESPTIREPRAPGYTFRPSTSLGSLLRGLLGLGQDIDIAHEGPPHGGDFTDDTEGYKDVTPEWQTPAAPPYTFTPAQNPPPPPPPPKTATLVSIPARPAIDVTVTESPPASLSGLGNEQGWRYHRAGSLFGLGESVFVVHRLQR